MRPIRLELTAFGPFADTQVIDFRTLGERRLFLVHGPTGAGKTTLLDAISFALYGDATVAEREGKGFRSQFAGPERTTSVTLDFALGERIYRIERQPEQERAKRRGEGTTTAAAAATLWDRTGVEEEVAEGHVLETGATRVSEKIAELLGFRSEQFRQVIVLPQGRFRDLLLARSREREEILRQLFDTDFYGRVEEALRQRSRELRAEADRLRARRGTLLAQEECTDEAQLEALLRRLEGEKTAVEGRLEALQRDSSSAAQALERARGAHARFAKLARTEATLDALRARQAVIEAERARLGAGRRAAGLADLAARLAELRDQEASADARLEELRGRQAAAREQLDAAVAELRVQQARAPERDALRARLAELERVTPLIKELAALWQRQSDAGSAAEAARTQVSATREAVATRRVAAGNLRQAREVGSAALLARDLQAGKPCPVCGSTVHPRPATDSQDIPSPRAIAVAEQASSTAEAELETALDAQRGIESLLSGINAEAASLEKQLAGLVEPTPDGLRAAQQLTECVRADLRAAQEALDRALEAERAGRELEVGLATALDEAAAQRESAGRTLGSVRAEWDRRLDKAGFASEEDFQQARLADDALERIAAEVESFDREIASADTRIAEARADVAGLEPPDLDTMGAAATVAAQAHHAAAEERGRLAGRVDALGQLLASLGEISADYAATEARFGVYGAIASVAGGENPHRVSLQRFVLASRLDDVLAAASRRLGLMSRGRYLLRRNVETADRRSAGGLELEVEDAYTANSRPVATLSGGESFQAALALALGLSEVVQAYAGGIRLETIFIDEGFGSLDPEALDLAIDMLLDLQHSGRLVGVISHVPELQERIDIRLEVQAGPAGSQASFRLP